MQIKRFVPSFLILLCSFSGLATAQSIPAVLDSTVVNNPVANSNLINVGKASYEIFLQETNFNKGIISTPEQLFQGRVAGVYVLPSSGEPGAAIKVDIRGVGSLLSGANPLYVVDGIPILNDGTVGYNLGINNNSEARNPLIFLNSDDIETITVLKDASTSLYGIRGANGVILINTKKGKQRERIQLTSSTGISQASKRYNLLSAKSFLDGFRNIGGDPQVLNNGGNTDWQSEIFEKGISQKYNLSIGGASNTGSYRLSIGHLDQKGVVKNSSLQNFTGRLNTSKSFFKERILIGAMLSSSSVKGTYSPNNEILGRAYITANPTNSIRNPDRSFYKANGFINPVFLLENTEDYDDYQRYTSNLNATFKIYKDLLFKTTYALDKVNTDREGWVSAYDAFIAGSGRQVSLKLTNNLFENALIFKKRKGKSDFEAQIAQSIEKFERTEDGQYGSALLDPTVLTKNLSAFRSRGAIFSKQNAILKSYFTAIDYNYNDRYIFSGTLRTDGSSYFSEGNRYSYYPSASMKWNVLNESNASKVDILSFRVNWGKSGNLPNILNGPSFNQNLKREVVTQISTGIDIQLFNGRFTSSIDYFNKETRDFLALLPVAAPSAIGRMSTNLKGKIQNSGLEVIVGARMIEGKRFNWNLNTNMTFLHNKVIGIGNLQIITGSISGDGLSGSHSQAIQENQSINPFFMRIFSGYDQNGLSIYKGFDAKVVANSIPKFYGGLTNNFTLGQFQASVLLQSATGFSVYNNTANAFFLKGNLRSGLNVTSETANSPESPANANSISTRFLEKGDYIRLSNASLSYIFKKEHLKVVKDLTLTVSGQNLLLITKYSGLDPEVNANRGINGTPSRGIDYLSYPYARTFTMGLKASL